MKNFFVQLFASVFGERQPTFQIGAYESPRDMRTINAAAYVVHKAIPEEFNHDMPEVEYQRGPYCVPEAIHKVKEYYLQKKNIDVDLSSDDLYDQCKAIDGIPSLAGTYPLVGAKLAVSSGICTQEVYETHNPVLIKADRANYKLGGFTEILHDWDSVTQALYANEVLTLSFTIDTNWYLGIIGWVMQSLGRHYVIAHGYIYSRKVLRGQNSWGVGWIGRIAGFIDPKLKPGQFNVYWPDVQNSVADIYAFTDSIPPEIISHVQNLNYFFSKPLKFGDTGYDVVQLQKRLYAEGYWPKGIPLTGNYYTATATAVLHYQLANKIVTVPSQSYSGELCGPKTLAHLNGAGDGLRLVEALIKQESAGNDYAIGDKGLAYGCLQIHQQLVDDVNKFANLKFTAKECIGNRELSLAIFRLFFQCYPQLKTNEERAKAWNGGPNWKLLYGKKGHEQYTKDLDKYWASVEPMLAK